jgi:hypothetical protein
MSPWNKGQEPSIRTIGGQEVDVEEQDTVQPRATAQPAPWLLGPHFLLPARHQAPKGSMSYYDLILYFC